MLGPQIPERSMDKELELVLKKPEVSGSHDLWGRQQKQKLGFIGAEAE